MRRGENVSEGFVNFPFDSPDYPIAGGRGMFVKLVVLESAPDSTEPLGMCCGVIVSDMRQEILVGDDLRPYVDRHIPDDAKGEEILKYMDEGQKAQLEWMRFHFPREGGEGLEAYISRGYRASIVMGSTGWSGYSNTAGNWRATFDDLTDDGKALYRLMQQLNPGCPVHLLTFLDT